MELGLAVDQTPYVSRGYATGTNGPLYIEDEYRSLQIERSAQGIVPYPLDRARRVEVAGGFRQITLSEDVTSRTYSLQTGQLLDEQKRELASFPSLNLGEASAALVHDTSIFGATSPIRGSRGRLEVSQSVGTLQYTGLLTDGRAYFMPVRPFTLAFRALYFGRYGRDGEDPRLPSMFLGYPGLVRGYDPGSFEAGECGVQPDGSCPAFDRLIGSRMTIGNAELRFPLLGLFGAKNFYGPLPIEMALFADAGVAWGSTLSLRAAVSDEQWVRSVGIAARMNLFGFAIGEVNYVRPLDRERGWVWQFALRPGF